jgi:hypothetical protein
MSTSKKNHRAKPPDQSWFVDSAPLSRTPDLRDWLVKPLLIAGLPGAVGIARRTPHTSIFLDLAISLATGTPFLGKFDLPRQRRVAVVYGESDEATVQETVHRIAAAKNVPLHEDSLVLWSFGLPQLSGSSHYGGFRRRLAANKIDVVFLDYLYICRVLAAGQGVSAAKLYKIRELLLGTARACLAARTTPVLVDHMGKTGKTRAKNGADAPPPARIDATNASIGEFARQWLLVGRRTPYQPGGGTHRLALNFGGRPMESGTWDVDIDEGVPGEDRKRREWNVQVRPHQLVR